MEMEVRLHMQLRAARVAPIHGLSYGSGQALRFPSEAEIAIKCFVSIYSEQRFDNRSML